MKLIVCHTFDTLGAITHHFTSSIFLVNLQMRIIACNFLMSTTARAFRRSPLTGASITLAALTRTIRIPLGKNRRTHFIDHKNDLPWFYAEAAPARSIYPENANFIRYSYFPQSFRIQTRSFPAHSILEFTDSSSVLAKREKVFDSAFIAIPTISSRT